MNISRVCNYLFWKYIKKINLIFFFKLVLHNNYHFFFFFLTLSKTIGILNFYLQKVKITFTFLSDNNADIKNLNIFTIQNVANRKKNSIHYFIPFRI